jgi:DNA-nicking Smr family endonuclease
MSDKRDTPSFMSRNFPDATPLQQNKQTTEKTKSFVRKSATGNVEPDLAPLRLPGNSTIAAGDVLSFQGNGVQNRLMRQLKQGKIRFENVLDLHGQTVEQAHQSTMQFIYQCQLQRQYCVLIIHGQGYRSMGGLPVLKQNVDFWLKQHDSVLAFHSATPADGGKGAAYILLRKSSG